MGKIKVLVADDQELVREGLGIVLSNRPEIEYMGAVSNGREVIQAVRQAKPDVILMDVRMPEMDGVTCTKIIKEQYEDIKIIILTTFDDDEYVLGALRDGASGYLLKGTSMKDLVNAIQLVNSGSAMINPDIAAKVVNLFSKMAQGSFSVKVRNDGIKELANTERKVTRLIGMGYSNKEIAAELSLSEGTIRNYLSSILDKLELRDRTQLAIWTVQTGVVGMED
jgi:DNA-binding NarL/FixJ family response regulator